LSFRQDIIAATESKLDGTALIERIDVEVNYRTMASLRSASDSGVSGFKNLKHPGNPTIVLGVGYKQKSDHRSEARVRARVTLKESHACGRVWGEPNHVEALCSRGPPACNCRVVIIMEHGSRVPRISSAQTAWMTSEEAALIVHTGRSWPRECKPCARTFLHATAGRTRTKNAEVRTPKLEKCLCYMRR
jgi:hypothetical protein